MPLFSSLPPLSLYIHIPWCVKKCPYCDFNSHAIRDGIPQERYINALINDLENELPGVWGRRVQSIFIGGGTPSTFTPDGIALLLDSIKSRIPVSPNAEITMEANPGTLDNQRLGGYFQAGINRLSIGVQSFDDSLLKSIGRIHDAAQARSAIEAAVDAGFDNFNIDLMFALPGQTPAQAIKDVETAIALNPTHISYYHLTIEANTWFHQHPPELPGDDDTWEIQSGGLELLAAHGYHRYEISAYAKQGKQSRHNLNYWNFGDYLGIGAGAHAKISRADTGSITRKWKEKHPNSYMDRIDRNEFAAHTQELDSKDIVVEFLMNALRLETGFSIDLFVNNTGLDESLLHQRLSEALNKQLVQVDETRRHVQPTEQGKTFLNELLLTLIE